MAVIYGVLRAKLDRWKREDPPPGAPKSPHLQIRVLDGHGKPWRIPVNVRSGDVTQSLVIFHRAEPLLSQPARPAGTDRTGPGDGQPAPWGLLKRLMQRLLPRCKRCRGAAAETGAHACGRTARFQPSAV